MCIKHCAYTSGSYIDHNNSWNTLIRISLSIPKHYFNFSFISALGWKHCHHCSSFKLQSSSPIVKPSTIYSSRDANKQTNKPHIRWKRNILRGQIICKIFLPTNVRYQSWIKNTPIPFTHALLQKLLSKVSLDRPEKQFFQTPLFCSKSRLSSPSSHL